MIVDTAWEQAGFFIFATWLIWGITLLSWNSGVKFWAWRRRASSRQR